MLPPAEIEGQLAALGLHVVTALFALALRLAAPVMASLILADLTLGLLGRSMPQMNILLVGWPAKIMIGLAAAGLSCPLLAGSLGDMMDLFQHYLLQIIHGMAGS